MFNRILIAVDGSDISELAMEKAVQLAAGQQSQLRIVHVVDVKMRFGEASGFANKDDLEKVLLESGQQVLRDAAATADNAGIRVETKLLEIEDFSQRVAEMIVGEATAWLAELIVVGTHGHRGLGHLFLRGVAEGIVRISPIPVLVIPRR